MQAGEPHFGLEAGPFSRGFTMNPYVRPFSFRFSVTSLAGFTFVLFVAMTGTNCGDASIVSSGDGGTTGQVGGQSGKAGTGGHGGTVSGIDTSVVGKGGNSGSGGTGKVCNSTDTSGCKQQIAPGCGDGVNNQPSEDCDDGNPLPGDGCNGACKVEPNWTCPKDIQAGPCTRKVICGDGTIGPGEVCDDGNTLDNDGCNSTCTQQDPAFQCTAGEPCKRTSECGNKRIESGEKCDDGNSDGGDGCSATCQLEPGWVCPKPGSPCKQAPRCGDSIVSTALGEVCDDGNQKDGDGCSADCKTKDPGCVCSPGNLCKCPTVKCGNGTVEGSEQCDDGNTKAGDGCSDTCQIEKGYSCPFFNAPCVADCGDGIVLTPFEQCDPGVATAAGSAVKMSDAC